MSYVDEIVLAFDADVMPLGQVPMDGTWEILHSGCGDGGNFVRFTPKHHLASVHSDSGALVIARHCSKRDIGANPASGSAADGTAAETQSRAAESAYSEEP